MRYQVLIQYLDRLTPLRLLDLLGLRLSLRELCNTRPLDHPVRHHHNHNYSSYGQDLIITLRGFLAITRHRCYPRFSSSTMVSTLTVCEL